MELGFSSPDSASSRTSKGTSRWDSQASSAIWKKWVTKCRGEYSARLNAARLTSGNEFSSLPWPTPSQRDYKGACASRLTPEGYNSRLDEAVIMFGPAAPANPSTHGSRRGLLNPDWVETLMGLPVGWTDCGCLGTELSPLPQNERSEH
jgi:hypothetical protein